MQATDSLSSDHRLIERVLATLDRAAERLEHGDAVPPQFFLDAARFIRGFADGCHHGKEEGVLFPALAANGMPSEGGPVAVMLQEHERGRAYTAGLREAAEALAAGDSSAAPVVAANARAYATLLRQHIYKEDNILFPMASRVIPADQHDDVMRRFETVEHEQPDVGGHAAWVKLVESLEARA